MQLILLSVGLGGAEPVRGQWLLLSGDRLQRRSGLCSFPVSELQ